LIYIHIKAPFSYVLRHLSEKVVIFAVPAAFSQQDSEVSKKKENKEPVIPELQPRFLNKALGLSNEETHNRPLQHCYGQK